MDTDTAFDKGASQNILELHGIGKRFPGVVALNQVSLEVRRGEVHALLGENGAGKSSLVKLLCGVYQPDEGQILFEGADYRPQTPLDAIRAGVRVVYQELNLLSYLSVAENIFFEKLPRRGGGLVDYSTLYAQTQRLLKEVGLDISPKTPVERLGIAQMQLLEIAKALSGESKVLILDEPTATLTPGEVARLFKIIARLKSRGVTIIYISHHLSEIFEIADRLTVLRNGQVVATKPVNEVEVADLVRMMVGRTLEQTDVFRGDIAPGPEMLRVENLRCKGSAAAVSFAVRRGEILGVAGLVGSGRTETMRALFGADPKDGGAIYINGQPVKIRQPRDAVKKGLGMLTEDRKGQGLLLDMACLVNITVTNLKPVSRWYLLRKKAEQLVATNLIKQLRVKTPSVNTPVRNLSGGNQQKVVLAKWLYRNSQVLIFDEPTRGIDVGAKYEIYTLLGELAAQGRAIIVVSSDLPELMSLCHRMIVFSRGKIAGEVERAHFDQETILNLAYREFLKPAS